jgi:hypothetical protein
MPSSPIKHLDAWSLAVIALTLMLFIAALFIKGFTHELLLESGVFLVSAKLVIMAHKNSALGELLQQRLESIESTLRQMDGTSRPR